MVLQSTSGHAVKKRKKKSRNKTSGFRDPQAGAKNDQGRRGAPQRAPQWRAARRAGPDPGAVEKP